MSQELVPAQPEAKPPSNQMAIPREWGIQSTYGQLVTSIDESTQAGKDELLTWLNEEGVKPALMINKEFTLRNVTIHPIRFIGEDSGEEINTVRVLLHNDEGPPVDFRSDGILKSLYLMFRYKGNPPYNPGHKVTLTRLDLNGGKSMYSLKFHTEAKKRK